MSYLNSGFPTAWLQALADDRGETFLVADIGGVPTWLVIAVVVLLLLAGLMWFWLGSDLVRYLKIKRM